MVGAMWAWMAFSAGSVALSGDFTGITEPATLTGDLTIPSFSGCGFGRELVTDPDLCRRIEVVRDDTGVARRRQPDDLGAGGVEAGAQLLAPSARELV